MNEPLNFIHLDCNFVSVPSTRVSVSASEVIHTPAPLCLFYGLFYLCTYTSLKVKPNCPFPSFCLLLKSYLILTLMSNLNPDQQGKKTSRWHRSIFCPQKSFLFGGGGISSLQFFPPHLLLFSNIHILCLVAHWITYQCSTLQIIALYSIHFYFRCESS